MSEIPDGWSLEPLIGHVKARSGNSKIIKGKNSAEPRPGLNQGFSASGPDVWVKEAEYKGPGVVVSAVGARCGKTFLADGVWTAIANTHVLIPEATLDPRFLWYLTNNERYWVRSGTAQPFVKVKDTLARPHLIPPLDEQRRIVAILEDHLSRLDEGERALARAESLAQTAWKSFLGRVLSRSAQSGAMREVGEVASTRLGKMLDAKRNTGQSTPYLRNQNVQWRAIDFDDVLEVPLSPSEISDLAVAAGDLLVCEGGEPGRCAVVEVEPPQPVAFQKALHRVRPQDGVSAHYLQTVLEALARTGMLEPLFTGTTIKHFPQERLRALEIPFPDIETQVTLAEEARSIRESLDLLSKETAHSRVRSQALRRALLSAAFSGELTKEPSIV